MKSLKTSVIRIILVRHGETEWNRLRRFQGRSDIALNAKGHVQASALAKVLQTEKIAAIYSSPLKRAMETAAHVQLCRVTIPLYKEPDLIEMDLGEFEGMEAKYWADHYNEFRVLWGKTPATLHMPEGESLEEVQSRAVSALKRICSAADPSSTVLLCSHNFVIVSLLCFVSGIPLNQFRKMRQDTAAMNIIEVENNDFQLIKINDTSHLKDVNLASI